MGRLTVDQVLLNISIQLHLSKETEHEILAEIRAHLEDAVADAAAKGADEQDALVKAAEQFGIVETGAELQDLHLRHDSIHALLFTALPVVFALTLRWLIFTPDGAPANWQQILVQPGFYLLAAVSLAIPVLAFRRWRLALASWAFFWLLSVIFVLFPNIGQW